MLLSGIQGGTTGGRGLVLRKYRNEASRSLLVKEMHFLWLLLGRMGPWIPFLCMNESAGISCQLLWLSGMLNCRSLLG